MKQAKYLDIPKAELGFAIVLDGEIVLKLIADATTAANHLLGAVDDWIIAN